MPEETSLIRLKVNDQGFESEVEPSTTLYRLLHDRLGCADVKYGCGEGVCGACTVLINGEPGASCITLALQANGAEVVTASGLGHHAPLAVRRRVPLLIEQLIAREAFQCGYCAPGMLVAAAHCISGDVPVHPDQVRHDLSGNICRCTGYQQIVESVVAASAGEAAPQVQNPREDIRHKLLGGFLFPSDVFPDGERPLVGRILWSEYPHAEIREVDVRAAAVTPGVVAVLTARDIPGKNFAGTTLFSTDQPILVAERARCVGDAVAIVAATSAGAAEQALRAIRVSYAPLPSVHDVLEALADDAPQLHPRGNVIAQFTKKQGDVEAGFRAADVCIEGTYRSLINDHACMELEGGVGWMEGSTLVICATSLTPHEVRAAVARGLGVGEASVRIETPRMGGSFGKYLIPGLEVHLALLVHKTGRPVRLFLERDEILGRRPKRHPFWGRYRLGAYVSLTPAVAAVFADEANGAYEIPHLQVRARGVLTNNPPAAPMRGFGSQQINFGMESIVEKAARTLGLDPAAIRRKNFLRTRTDSRGRERPYTQDSLSQTLDVVAEALGARPEPPTGWLSGRGVASIRAKYGYPYGTTDRFVARVSVQSDGRCLVEADIADSGTGIPAALPRIVAQALHLDRLPVYKVCQLMIDDPSGTLLGRGQGTHSLARWTFRTIERFQKLQATLATALTSRLGPERLTLVLRLIAWPVNLLNGLVAGVKSRLFPLSVDSYSPRTSGSRGMLMAGQAVALAASKLRDQALRMAAQALRVPASNLVLDGNGVHDNAVPDRRLSWAEIATRAGGQLTAVGDAQLPYGYIVSPKTGNQLGCIDHMYASHGCDIAINPATGEVSVLRFVACHDVGKALDPEIIRGQIIGSICMGVGQTLWEHIPAHDGRVDISGLHDYRVATSLDAPVDVDVRIVESGSGFGPHGAKGVGEAGAVAAPIAIANAIYDALGMQISTITCTPEDIARVIQERAAHVAGASA
jgi:CO/xanthine dehydrogenase Mo-binding subunit/aerobic-type carbon monoxide dehydrogenase small subunit (CoxS/CutS family)